ncbi:MAG: serine hydrolase [Propionibacteriaceae bacterium]|nr:serine hydrolase [Propionibacteriaceae bacterium]
MGVDLAAVERVVDEAAPRVPGLAVAVVGTDGEPALFLRGAADVAKKRPIDEATVFRIGSISKTYTAMAFMRLVERGLVGVDDAVGPVLGDVLSGTWASEVTYRHLLTHTAGLGEVRHLPDLWGCVLSLGVCPGRSAPSLEEYYARGVRQCRRPGEWTYANHGFGLLGLAIERLTGEGFAAHLRRLMSGLGLEHADYERTPHLSAHLARGYRGTAPRWSETPDYDIAVAPAGSILSDVADQARYAQALLRGVPGVLSPEGWAEMTRPQLRPLAKLPGMGLGFMTRDVAGIETIEHGGGWVGFVSMMIAAPAEGVAVVAFSNHQSPVPGRVADEALRAALGKPSGDDEYARHSGRIARHFPDYVGVYGPAGGGVNANFRHLGEGWETEIVRHGDGLALRRAWGEFRRPARLAATEVEDVFAVRTRKGLAHIGFVRDGQGRVTGLVDGRQSLRRLGRPGARTLGLVGVSVAAGMAARAILRRRQARG